MMPELKKSSQSRSDKYGAASLAVRPHAALMQNTRQQFNSRW
jgi:hypothetical protein